MSLPRFFEAAYTMSPERHWLPARCAHAFTRWLGYGNVRVDGHVERRVNEAEAAIVRRIFEMYAERFG